MISKKNYKKTIEELEDDYWVSPSSFPTDLVKKVYLLRKKPLNELEPNDARLLISQNVGLKYAVPIAVEKLTNDILKECVYYPGDLLLELLQLDSRYWLEHDFERNQLISILKKSKSTIVEQLDDDDDVDQEILKSIAKFFYTFPDSEIS